MTLRLRARPGRRSIHLASLATVVAAVVGGAGLVWQASYSAFSSTTSNGPDSWAAGTVALADDDSGTAMFTATNLKPGSTGTKCIAVTSSGSLPSSVKLYTAGYTTTNALGGSLNLTVTLGTGGTFGGGCGAFVADPVNPAVVSAASLTSLSTSAAGYSTGLGAWSPTGSGSETRTYRFDYTLDPAAPGTVAGGTAAVTFVWEAQNS